jgi:hypothetical protein
MVIVDDHLALLAVAGRALELGGSGPVVTTTAFQFRLARAVADSTRTGSLSRALEDPAGALTRVLAPPAHRLVVLDPRSSMAAAVDVAIRHHANFLLAELAGAAIAHEAAIRVTTANVGKTWPAVMRAEGIDFDTIQP